MNIIALSQASEIFFDCSELFDKTVVSFPATLLLTF